MVCAALSTTTALPGTFAHARMVLRVPLATQEVSSEQSNDYIFNTLAHHHKVKLFLSHVLNVVFLCFPIICLVFMIIII